MPVKPFTHHEILTLIEPFTRRGRQLDLAASDRLQRRLDFKPVTHPAAPGGAPLQETLRLDNRYGAFRLTRMLSDGRLEARLEAEGDDLARLLADIEAVPPRRHFGGAPDAATASSYRVGAPHGVSGDPLARLILTRWTAAFDGLLIAFAAPERKGDLDGAIELRPAPDETLALPDDLLAVLGWDWDILERRGGRWKSALRLRGAEPERSRAAERKLEAMRAHVAQTLADSPGRFHERKIGARWGVALRRALPLLIFFGLVGAALASARLPLAEDSPVRMVILNVPPLLFLLVFCLRRLPRIEVPPLPRRPTAPAWRAAAPERR